jgi:hypothetical protein
MGGSEVLKVYPPAHGGPEGQITPIRYEKKWLQGLPPIRLGVTLFILLSFVFVLIFAINMGGNPPPVLYLIFLLMMLPFIVYTIVVLLRTSPARFEMDPTGVRLYRGSKLVKEIQFGPQVVVGVVTIGYWDDMSPGMTLKAAGVNENEFSMFDRNVYGPLFGYKFTGGGKRIVISRKYGWDLRWIQWMWTPLMEEVGRHGMRFDRSMERYMEKGRRSSQPVR